MTKIYEARLMGGNMMMLFDSHEDLVSAVEGARRNKEAGKIRHFVVQLVSIGDDKVEAGEG